MNCDNCKAYKLIETRDVPDINSKAYLLFHEKTGAKVLVLENDDDNKVFSIGFRTPPGDSTGLPHIMEHSVLCGSKKYPSKDPFVELAKGSLNTFLNAMTYPDKTVYPVASCNPKDFRNLVNVYLDAVFYPNIYSREEIFRQEGWHYELENADDSLAINGVVYNEMKGAFSSPDDLLDRRIFDSLFPDNCYGLESGGDPDVIPELTYEAFLDFHKKYYHPSNSYIYLYGNADMEDTLDFIDRDYLSQFEKREINSEIETQKAFDSVREYEYEYSVTEGEKLEDNTYLSYNAVIDTSLNRELYLAFEIVEYALLGASGAVLKEALIKAGIGKDVLSNYDNGVKQPYFSIVSKNANESDKDRFVEIIMNTLNRIVKEGFDKKVILAGINSEEFRYREADFGLYPKGLMYGLQSFDSWLYDGDPIMHIAQNDTFAFLREMVDTDYFEQLVKKYLIDNTHASVVLVKPVPSLTSDNDAKLAAKLAEYKASLSEDEINNLIASTKHLKEYQETGDSEEVLALLPMLSIDDLRKEAEDVINELDEEGEIRVLKHNVFTNGIAYVKLLFNMDKVPAEDLQYASLLKQLLGLLDTANYSYADLESEINLNSGGISTNVASFSEVLNPEKNNMYFIASGRVMYDKLGFAFDMFREILFGTDFSDNERLRELINMLKSRMQASMMGAAHSFAQMRALANTSKSASLSEHMNGISFYRFVDELASDFDNKVPVIKEKLKECLDYILTKDNFALADITSEERIFSEYKKLVADFIAELPDTKLSGQDFEQQHFGNEGFRTSGKVQYVARAGRYMDEQHKFTGSLRVLKSILGYDYLWNNVRVMGGAYGCFSMFSKQGDGYFVSYRDPNLKETLDIYDRIPEYCEEFTADLRTMTKYIIGTIASMDTPLTPSIIGVKGLGAYLTKDSQELRQRERDAVLGCSVDDIRMLSEYVRKVLDSSYICVIGSEEAVNREEALFDSTDVLY